MKNFLFFLLCFVAINGYTQQTVTYNFAPHQQVNTEDGYSELIIENCHFIGEEGTPNLPVFGTDLLLEPGHEIDQIKIKSVEFYPAVENINIRPTTANFPISKGAPAGYKVVPNPDIYYADKDYPENIISGKNSSFLRGYAIGSFLIYPVIYNPVQKKAVLIKTITLEVFTVSTAKATDALRFLRNDIQTAEKIKQTTQNRDEIIVNKYHSLCKRNDNPNYDLLIVTKQSFVSALDNYIAHKNLWGYKVLVKTVEDIYNNYSGMDNAEKVRNCVIDAYENEGISYLLLFGDSHPNSNSQHQSIPYRKMYVNANNTIDELPSDMYFACLDGDWYNSNTGLWGEYGHEDLTHEISVGRICADNVAEIETFVQKLIKYQTTPVVEDIKKALMVGEMLNDNPITWGGDCKDQVAAGGSFNGYTTAGIPADYTINKLYEKTQGNWSTTQLRNYFNNTGAHFVNHLGHSHVTYNMKLSNWDITNNNFTNTGIQRTLSIVYSQGCLNGAFDNIDDWGDDVGQDCINEMFHKINGGVVANIGNSRYGWYNPGGTNGPSQRFDRYFFDGIFGKNIFTIGDANTYSKDINKAYTLNNMHLRWCCYELSLLGDPSMDVWTDVPTEFDPQFISVVKEGEMEFLISTGVPFARVAILQDSELISRGLCDVEGNARLFFDTPCELASAILSLTGHNKYRYEQQGLEYTEAPPVRDLKAIVDGTTVVLEWEEPDLSKSEQPDFYAVYRDGIMLKKLTSDILSYTDEDNLSWNTTYEYCVRALYSVFASIPVCLSAKTDPFCAVVGNLSGSVRGKNVILTWEKPELFPPKKYSIFRDGIFLKETTALFAVDITTEYDNEYEYCVVAQYEGCATEGVCVKLKISLPSGISETETDFCHIFPNPTNGELRITNYELRIDNIEIYDVFSRKLQPHHLIISSSHHLINISHLAPGIYFVKIATEQGVTTKKVIKQ